MKMIRVKFNKGSKFLEKELPRDHVFYAFKNEDQPYENQTILIVDDCAGWRNQHIIVNNQTGISSSNNFVVEPADLTAI
jgi:hypothetical protein